MPLLVALLPGIYLLARAILDRVALPGNDGRVLTPVVLLSLLTLCVHTLGLLSHSYRFALISSALALGGIGYLLALRQKQLPVAPLSRSQVLLFVVLIGVAFVPVYFWNFHDEMSYVGHLSIPSAIQNGYYPPRLPTFPQFELRYHYGFDLLVAIVSTLFRLRIDHAVDWLTLLGFAYAGVLFYGVGEKLHGPRAGWITATLVLFSGGIPWGQVPPGTVCTESPILCGVLYRQIVGTIAIHVHSFSLFFQHPWGLGILWAGAILLLLPGFEKVSRAQTALLSLLLLSLANIQFVLFLNFTGGLLLYSLVKKQWKVLLGVVVAALVSTQLHGFFAPSYATQTWALKWATTGIAGDWWSSLRWNLLSLGIFLPLGLWGLKRLKNHTLLFAILIGGNILIYNCVRYAFSNDIDKFTTAAMFFLSIASAGILSALWRERRRTIVVALLLIGVSWSFGSLLTFWFFPGRIPFPRAKIPLEEVEVIHWLRANASPLDLIYRRRSAALSYALLGGLSVPWVEDGVARSYGIDPLLIAERVSEPERIKNIKWFVIDSRDSEALRQHVAPLELAFEAKDKDLKVYRVP